MEKLGVELLYHLKDFSSMGFSEVIGKIPFYFKALKKLENEVIKRGTKTAIVIDFQDFNLRLAQKLSKRGVKVLYYVAPQAWAWKAHRTEALKTASHTLFTILPFEKKWFADRGVKQVRGIPHPLMLTFENQLSDIPERPFGSWDQKLKILLLPGSRGFEVRNLLPEFINTTEALRKTHDVEVHLVKVSHISEDHYSYFESKVDVIHESNDIVKAMKECHFALAASGTVTLSTGLFELPTVVAYRASLLNEFIFHHVVRYRGMISLTNIIHGKLIFPEFIQGQAHGNRFLRVIKFWLADEKTYNEIKKDLKETKHLLAGDKFSVPEYMAQVIHD